MADTASRMVGSASHTACSVNRPAEAFNHMAGSSSRTAGRCNRTHKSFIRTAETASHAGKSSSRTVFRQNHAESGKNRLFSPSSHARCSKNDSSGWGCRPARQRLGLRQPSAAFERGVASKAAEDCRTPKPCGQTCGHSPRSTYN